MGKNLKGKELGVGISQRKDGLYTARFTDRNGKRKQQYFKKLQECRQWLADAQFQDEHGSIDASGDMTVDAWFEYWTENIKSGSTKHNTVRNYKERYKYNIKPYMEDILLKDVKPLHCQNVLNQMFVGNYKDSTINLTRITMNVLFDDAVDNGLITKNPITKSVKVASGNEVSSKRAMSVNEQKHFLEMAKDSSYFNQYSLVLQTGLRTGELTALKWSDVDFENRVLHIRRTMDFRNNEWKISTTKTKNGKRDIPLTKKAIEILLSLKRDDKKSNIIPMEYHDFVFLSKNGKPILNSAYNLILRRICEKSGIERFSMHELRHTFATRCIDAGMTPKALQEILGHANISTTMDIYVHVTKDSKSKELESVEAVLNVV